MATHKLKVGDTVRDSEDRARIGKVIAFTQFHYNAWVQNPYSGTLFLAPLKNLERIAHANG
jgi:hypothetical protein